MIDLRSDSATLPTPDMRRAIADSVVGDSRIGEDPAVNRLEDFISELLGKDSSLFVPTATMANEIAIKVHTRPGDHIVADRLSHVVQNEGGAPAFISGVTVDSIDSEGGMLTEEDLLSTVRPDDPRSPRTSLAIVENAHSLRGGVVLPIGRLMAMADIAERLGLAVHLDGSRLMNAVVASDISAREFSYYVDSVTFSFYKGLGAPAGAVLAGSKEFIKEARRIRQVLGGSLHQAGVLASAALYSVQHNVERLSDDHENAVFFATLLSKRTPFGIEPSSVQTNVVDFEVSLAGLTASAFVDALKMRGVLMSCFHNRVRAVTHIGIARSEILEAADAVSGMMGELRQAA